MVCSSVLPGNGAGETVRGMACWKGAAGLPGANDRATVATKPPRATVNKPPDPITEALKLRNVELAAGIGRGKTKKKGGGVGG